MLDSGARLFRPTLGLAVTHDLIALSLHDTEVRLTRCFLAMIGAQHLPHSFCLLCTLNNSTLTLLIYILFHFVCLCLVDCLSFSHRVFSPDSPQGGCRTHLVRVYTFPGISLGAPDRLLVHVVDANCNLYELSVTILNDVETLLLQLLECLLRLLGAFLLVGNRTALFENLHQ